MNHLRMRFPGGLGKAFTMSYDDGVEQDIRLIQIMRENGVKGTFNLNSGLYAPEGTEYPAGRPKGSASRPMPEATSRWPCTRPRTRFLRPCPRRRP